MENRRNFIKKACLSGVCLCGFAAILNAKPASELTEALNAGAPDDLPKPEQPEPKALRWIRETLSNIDANLTEDQARAIIKSASIADFETANRDQIFKPFKGDVDALIKFLEEKWGWVIHTENDGKTIIADENKPHCVCSLLAHAGTTKYPALCYCSEGYAESMFSYVVGKPVTARIISAIQRGDKTCIYRIDL